MHNGRSGRRRNAMERLEQQLKDGTKNTKEGTVELTDDDRKRISNEIDILKAKV